MSNVTVLGGSGFIGSHLVRRLGSMGIDHHVPARGADLSESDLGCVVYCVGVTADFRTRPLDTVEAHVCHLIRSLRSCHIGSLIYLSSTRLYRRCRSPATEADQLPLDPSVPDDLYDLSKAMGEATSLAAGRPVHILRLSNVYGTDVTSPTFLPSVLRQAVEKDLLVMRTSADSVKDYISLADVVDIIVQLATGGGRESIYNVASGTNVSHGDLVDRIAALTGCRVEWAEDGATLTPPVISIARLRDEFDFRPRSVLNDLPDLLQSFRRELDTGRPSVG